MYARARVKSSDSKEYLKKIKEGFKSCGFPDGNATRPPAQEFRLESDSPPSPKRTPETPKEKKSKPVSFDYDGDRDFHGPELDGLIAFWRQSFPALDIDRELGKARNWLVENSAPSRRKKDIKAFLCRWLAKAQNYFDRAGPVYSGQRPQTAQERFDERRKAINLETGKNFSGRYDEIPEDPILSLFDPKQPQENDSNEESK